MHCRRTWNGPSDVRIEADAEEADFYLILIKSFYNICSEEL